MIGYLDCFLYLWIIAQGLNLLLKQSARPISDDMIKQLLVPKDKLVTWKSRHFTMMKLEKSKPVMQELR